MINQSTIESYRGIDDLLERARHFAIFAHTEAEQKRKYTNDDYIVHPASVAVIVGGVKNSTDEMVAAAWLHDVVEDTQYTLEIIRYMFGDVVGDLVEMLTDVSKPEDGNRATRKSIDREHTAKASPEAQTIKLADLLDNTETILEHDKDFAKVYIKEKAELIKVLKKGDKGLLIKAKIQIDAAAKELGLGNVW